MSQKFQFIGWNTEGNSDKIWGYFLRPGRIDLPYWANQNHGHNCCVFWGRRGKAMQFKADVTGEVLDKLIGTKIRKGYMKIDESKLHAIWPTFIEEAEAKLMWEILAGRVK